MTRTTALLPKVQGALQNPSLKLLALPLDSAQLLQAWLFHKSFPRRKLVPNGQPFMDSGVFLISSAHCFVFLVLVFCYF